MTQANTMTIQDIVQEYGRDTEGRALFGRTYLHMMKSVDAKFPKPVRGGMKGSRLHYARAQVEEYFKAKMDEGLMQSKLLENYYKRHIQAQAAQIMKLINETDLDLKFEIRTKTSQVVWYFDSKEAADAFEANASRIEERLYELGWTFKFDYPTEEVKEAS